MARYDGGAQKKNGSSKLHFPPFAKLLFVNFSPSALSVENSFVFFFFYAP